MIFVAFCTSRKVSLFSVGAHYMSEKINEYLQRGPATSREIQAATGLSQAAVSRHLRGMGDRVVRVREGRAILYAVTRNAFGGTDKLPLSEVDSQGNAMLVAFLRPLAHGGFFREPCQGVSSLLLGENKQSSIAMATSFLRIKEEILLQRFIRESNGKDIRVFVVGGEVVATMERSAQPGEFRSNLHRGPMDVAKTTREGLL